MWICKYCNLNFEYDNSKIGRSKKANHSHWCNLNPKVDYYKSINGKHINGSWSKGLTKETSPILLEKANKQKEYYTAHCGAFTGRTHSEETKQRISNSMNGNRNANNRGDRQSYYNNIRMDSRWEIWTAEYFDNNNIEWKYSEKGFVLSNKKVYYPDFFIYKNGIFEKLIEVKGYFRIENKKKFEMFKEEYSDIIIELWEKEELKNRGIINKSGKCGFKNQ